MAIQKHDRVRKDGLTRARGRTTQRALAEQVEAWLRENGHPEVFCSEQRISRIETGAVRNPDAEIVAALSAVLEKTPAELDLQEPPAIPPGQRLPRGSQRLAAITSGGRTGRGPSERETLYAFRRHLRHAVRHALDPTVQTRVANGRRSTTPLESHGLTLVEQQLPELRRFDDLSGSGDVYHLALANLGLLLKIMRRCESRVVYGRCADLAVQLLTFCAFALYDQDDLSGAREHMDDAFSISGVVTDKELAVHVIVYQALYAAIDGQTDEALALAAGILLTRQVPRFNCRAAAWTFVMLARVYALCGVAPQTHPLLLRAKSKFSECPRAANPPWIHYFDEARLKAYVAACHADLGETDDAIAQLREALPLFDPRYHRAVAHYRTLYADLLLRTGDAETAGAEANVAAMHADKVWSPRVRKALREFTNRLEGAS